LYCFIFLLTSRLISEKHHFFSQFFKMEEMNTLCPAFCGALPILSSDIRPFFDPTTMATTRLMLLSIHCRHDDRRQTRNAVSTRWKNPPRKGGQATAP
jgi:hypothetical protein